MWCIDGQLYWVCLGSAFVSSDSHVGVEEVWKVKVVSVLHSLISRYFIPRDA